MATKVAKILYQAGKGVVQSGQNNPLDPVNYFLRWGKKHSQKYMNLVHKASDKTATPYELSLLGIIRKQSGKNEKDLYAMAVDRLRTGGRGPQVRVNNPENPFWDKKWKSFIKKPGDDYYYHSDVPNDKLQIMKKVIGNMKMPKQKDWVGYGDID